ncbi:hypothetical protein GIB67_037606 [Kingdonia uniflora]|uniref:Alpha-1,3-mannosyl-glycoprotein 2-beta-N-acetylglucosaminyltransferase n=1 Tax=Kingdonia uniflora TaxID=39325 RepID=A0A7J7LSE8_9MAGN|nr:hypothetical protein GIB67_037606 [Kingdonia uniflora]
MAQDFVGSNNIYLLLPNGQFGNRHQGGKDHASVRYVYTCLSLITRFLYPKDDDCLLDYLSEDGQSIGPTWYMPTIPMVLVNSSEGYDLIIALSAAFIYIQIWLFRTQFCYADRLALKGAQNVVNKLEVPVAAVVVMACNRLNYLERIIESILKYQCSVASKFLLLISQDGPNENLKHKALSYNQITYMQHMDFELVQTERPGELIAYYKIASHYKWVLDRLFYKHNFTRVIILEDDMESSPDFFDYFEAAATLMDKDRTIMAVSSGNDNGQKQFAHYLKGLYRSDLFPGLGWMLTKVTWDELSLKWPKAYWDDVLRLKENHKDRQFIHLEVCRT